MTREWRNSTERFVMGGKEETSWRKVFKILRVGPDRRVLEENAHGEKSRDIVLARIASSASRAATRRKSANELLSADTVEFQTASRFTNLQRPLGRPSPGHSMLRSQWLMYEQPVWSGKVVRRRLLSAWVTHSHSASDLQNWAYSLGDFSLDKVGANGRCLNLCGKVRDRIIAGPDRWFSLIDCTGVTVPCLGGRERFYSTLIPCQVFS